MKRTKTKLSHGICQKCGFEIVCVENLTCFQHSHITCHLDLNDCIEKLKSKVDGLEVEMFWLKHDISIV